MGSTAKYIIEEQNRLKRGRIGCYLKLALLAGAVVLGWHFVIRPVFESGFGMADTREVPGDPTRFDPIASYQAVRDYAGDNTELVSIDAYYVRSDGTLDLTVTNYTPRVVYEFTRETPRPADAPPIGAGGTAGKWYENISIEAYQPGKWWSVSSSSGDYSFMNKGMEREVEKPTSSQPTTVPAPRCSFADLWAEALKHDAPRDAVAIIEYDRYGYRFSISGLSIDLRFDMECGLDD